MRISSISLLKTPHAECYFEEEIKSVFLLSLVILSKCFGEYILKKNIIHVPIFLKKDF